MTRYLMSGVRDTDPSPPEATDQHVPADPVAAHATVLPGPVATTAAAVLGGLTGLATIYVVSCLLADTLAGVAVIAVVFAVTMAGPWVHARANSELRRTLAVGLQAIAFGGALAAVIISI